MFLEILGASLVGSVFALVGGVLLLWKEQLARRFSLTLVSFAAGSLIAAAFLELIPESINEAGYAAAAPFLMVGIFAVFIFEKFLNWYHCHDQGKCDYHSFSGAVLFGDSIHNFIDGIAIALSFTVSVPAGIATTVAVFFHEVPQEIGDFGVLLHAGYTRSRVLLLNFLTALTTPLGAIIGFLLLPWIAPVTGLLLAFAAGSFLYIAISDLLPELRHKPGADLGHMFALFLGIAAIVAVGLLFPE